MATTNAPGTLTTTQPDWWTQNVQSMTNVAGGFAGPEGQIEQTYNNWYSQPLTADWNDNLQRGGLSTATGATWSPTMTSAIEQADQASQWDANTQQQFMNPYLDNVIGEMTRQSNQNLFENVMPGVNSTFTGQGQFGSTRNADFMNRAIRDQQQQLTGNIGNQLFNAQNQAGTQYSDWANKEIQGAREQGNLATAGAALGQQDWQNQMTAGKTQQDWQQGMLDRSYKDWLTEANYPVQQYGALSQIFSNLRSGVPTGQMFEPAAESGLTDAQKLAALVAMATAPANPGSTGGETVLEGAYDWIKDLLPSLSLT